MILNAGSQADELFIFVQWNIVWNMAGQNVEVCQVDNIPTSALILMRMWG